MRVYLKDVRSALKKDPPTTFNADEVMRAFRSSSLSKLHTWVLDEEYKALSEDMWKLILEYSQVDKLKYAKDTIDCDDFSRILQGEVLRKLQINGIGFVIDISSRHAYVCLLVVENSKLQVVAVEPQNDGWKVASSNSNIHRANSGVIII